MGGSWCCVVGCTNYSRKTQKVRVCYHNFPSDSALREKWISAIRRDNWLPSKWARVCSDHFSPESYNDSVHLMEAFGLSKQHFYRRLKADAVPTVYKETIWQPAARRKAIKRKAEDAYKALALTEAGHAESSNQHDWSCHGDTTTQCSDEQGAQPHTRDAYVQITAHAQSPKAVQTYSRMQSIGVQASPRPTRDSCDQTDDVLLYRDKVLPEVRPLCSTPKRAANAPGLNLSRLRACIAKQCHVMPREVAIIFIC
ncbi:peroxynitrite isomerase THAP4 isoform X2 [Rhipicephalus sanguineus]|uniref:peroxynitrite isomerase THAP4 isoform X2 n=1 Tax=Rhipicephalus sanguineus TaxID=34632 RepID=UPI001895F1D2|nr:peroxynitrite isomerase THAP4 isoform X2 [Rhipicephalus sanguineus]